MSNEVLVGILALTGTLFGSLGGILTANRLVMYRIEQLEKKVERHNNVIERTVVLERDMKTAFTILDLKKNKED